MKPSKRPTMLMILDGFGINDNSYGNAIAMAKTPNIDEILNKYPHTKLNACGEAVGLPKGQMGNSEVGHLNIGAGRIVHQDLSRITHSIDNGTFFQNDALNMATDKALNSGKHLHILGLLSDGGVHSHIEHLMALIDMAHHKGLKQIYIHCFLDGRDVPPRCAENYLTQLENKVNTLGIGRIATISGRYYSMDRDKRWDRIQLAYDAMTLGIGEKADTAISALRAAYERGENDEFVKPTVVQPFIPIQDDDSIIMYNFRPDRAREITRALVDENFNDFKRTVFPKSLCYVTMTEYDATMPNVSIAYPPEHLENTLGEYISSLGLRQLRIAETEKYAHVTFFFNGGVEAPVAMEDRVLVPSPSVPTYDLQPEMSAAAVTQKVIEAIHSHRYDMIILNFANADMVGHTGIINAAKAAIEALDKLVPQIVKATLYNGGQILLTADHGNADEMLDKDGKVVTSHSLNLVPLVHISDTPCEFKAGIGKLADIAPTMLTLMNLPIPPEMTGDSLLK